MRFLGILASILFAIFTGSALAEMSLFMTHALDKPAEVYAIILKLVKSEPYQDISDYHRIDTCTYTGGEYPVSRKATLIEYFHAIASNQNSMERTLLKAGYPRAVWESLMNAMIDRQISIVASKVQNGSFDGSTKEDLVPAERKLVGALDNYRQKFLQLPKFSSPEVCGGDWIGYVKLRSNPVGAWIRVISEFNFKICRANGYDPYTGCNDLWTVVGPSTEIPQGKYVYTARWGVGPEECFSAELINSGASAKTETNVIQQSKKGCSQ